MAFESNFITFIGNLTDDPELRYTGGGNAVVTLRVASNRRYTDRSGNQQEETTCLNVNAWRDLAENAAESLSKGDRVIVVGRVKVRSYENQQGQTVWVTEIEADEIAPSLRWARASLTKSSGSSGGSSGGSAQGQASTAPAPPSDDDVPF
jgi:single-strand DNA-binding protein